MKVKMTSPPGGGQSLPDEAAKEKYNSRDLFHGQQEILIEHAGHAYRLRITRQGKLILTK